MKKIILSLVVLSLMSLPASAAGKVNTSTFFDVSVDHFYHNAIEFLVGRGIVVGNPDGSFEPDEVLNRAEALTMVSKASYIYNDLDQAVFDDYEDDNCFNDVVSDSWYTKYVCYAFTEGWVVGYGDGYFSPGNTVNFVEALKILYKAFDFYYKEDENIWYKPVVDDASFYNYIPVTISAFDQPITRAEMSDMIARIINYDEGDLDDYLGEFDDIVVNFDTIFNNIDLLKLLESGEEFICKNDGVSYPLGSSIEKDDCSTCFCNSGGDWFCINICGN